MVTGLNFIKNKIEIFNYKLNNNLNVFKIIYLLIKLSYFFKKEILILFMLI